MSLCLLLPDSHWYEPTADHNTDLVSLIETLHAESAMGSLNQMFRLCRGYFAIDMGIGALILGVWQYFSPADALLTAPLVASGLIAGDGIWSVPSAVLSLVKIEPPLCAQAGLSSTFLFCLRVYDFRGKESVVLQEEIAL